MFIILYLVLSVPLPVAPSPCSFFLDPFHVSEVMAIGGELFGPCAADLGCPEHCLVRTIQFGAKLISTVSLPISPLPL
jgi:hypothetical protein